MPVFQTERQYVGDLVKAKFNDAFNFETARLQAVPAMPLGTSFLGYPLGAPSAGVCLVQTQAQVAAYTGTSSCGVCCDESLTQVATLANTATTQRFLFSRRGPLVVNRKALRTADPAGAAYNMTLFIAALLVSHIVVVDETGATITT